MTHFIIVFEILFLILIASRQSHASLSSQDDHLRNLRHLQRPPDWWPPTRTQADRENANIYSENYQDSALVSNRRAGRTKRHEDGLALFASSTGLSSSSATLAETTTTSVPSQPQDEETSKFATSWPTASNSDAQSSLSAAELCYLASGGSSLTLTVNEATPVGSLIGTIDVNGDPSLEGGNVDLVDGLDQAASGTFSSPDSASAAAAAAAGLTSSRQNRRLLGRRDTAAQSSASEEGATRPVTAALTSPFYALLGSSTTTTAATTTSSPATTMSTNANQQPLVAVRVQPGTKNLLLARPLDKESPEGDSSLLVNVRCRARPAAQNNKNQIHGTSSTSSGGGGGNRPKWNKQSVDSATYTTIPIRLIVTDANDQAPEFVAPPGSGGLPYVINISETTPVNSIASRDILAIDKDSAGPHSTIHYRVLGSSGEHTQDDGAQLSNLFAFTNPLEPTLWLTGPLDYESLPAASFTLTIVAQDQGEPEPLQTTAQVQVNVLDFDDQNPKFLDEKYTLVMDEIQASLVGQNLRVLPRNLRAEDGDRGINAPILYSFDLSSSSSTEFAPATDSPRQPLVEFNDSLAPAAGSLRASDPALQIEQYLHLNPTSGELRLIRQWPSGPASLPLTLVIRATQADNRDRYALTTLTITRAAAGSTVAGGPIGNSQATGGGGDSAARQAGGRQVGDVAAKAAAKRGIEFAQERVSVQVPEDAPVSEKIARVRAQHLVGANSGNSQQVEPTNDPEIAIQKQRLMQLVAASSPSSGANNNPRPINYQILDDQTDQFGINGLGEILLKRPLDYEQRQEFKFRVLATYTRHSDICHVHVQVMNVNDNKPKFTQSQYSFHLTESRLRSNSLGQVVAHDADLNDTIQYSILPASGGVGGPSPPQEQCARLFEINPASGQLSLRTSTRALNTSQCQVIVQASDSLVSQSPGWHSNGAHGTPQPVVHQQQVRVNIYVAPQLIGRSLDLSALITARDHQQQPAGDHETKLSLSSRSLQAEGAAAGWRGQKFVSASKDHAHLAVESSTIATTHNFHQPVPPSSQRSSMATVVASLQHMMKSVNFFEMPMSSALLLSVLLTFLVCLLLIVIISMSVHVYKRRSKSSSRVRHLTAAARMRHAHFAAAAAAAAAAGAGTGSSNAGSSPSSSSSSSSVSSSSSPATTTTHSISSPPPPLPPPSSHHYQQQYPKGGVANRKSLSRDAAAEPQAANHHNSYPQPISTSPRKEVGVSPSANNITTSPTDSGNQNRTHKKPQLSKHSDQAPLGQLKISISGAEEQQNSHLFAAPTNSQFKPTTKLNPLYLETPLAATGTLKSPLGSYRSAISSTDDSTSSLANCGHYSVNGTMELNPQGRPQGQPAKSTRSSGGRNKLELAISDLAKQEAAASAACGNGGNNKLRQQQQQELEQLTRGQPGVRAYRPLPMMNSLARPLRKPPAAQLTARGRSNKVAPFEQLLSSHQQRIAQQQAAEQQQQLNLRATSTSAAGLMALVRDSIQLSGGNGGAEGRASTAGSGGESSPQIRWPSESIPHKIKKLTWDDEMSCCDNESMLGIQDFNNNNNNQVNDNDGQQQPPVSEQSKFLFSLNSHMNSLNQQQHGYAAPSMDAADQNGFKPLSEQQLQNHQNNCQDYTFVESSQFHVDSLASVDMRSLMSPNRRLSYNQDLGVDERANLGSSQRLNSSTTTTSQNATTFKLNQNYQDLKLMTTAVL